jgi:hypothetical protein
VAVSTSRISDLVAASSSRKLGIGRALSGWFVRRAAQLRRKA